MLLCRGESSRVVSCTKQQSPSTEQKSPWPQSSAPAGQSIITATTTTSTNKQVWRNHSRAHQQLQPTSCLERRTQSRMHARTSSPNRVSYRDLDCATRELPPGAAAPLVVVNSPYRSASSPALRPPPLVEDPAGDPKKSASPPSTSLLFPTPPTARRMEADCGGDWLLWVFLEVEPTAGDADADADPPLPPPPPKKWVDLSIHFRGVGGLL